MTSETTEGVPTSTDTVTEIAPLTRLSRDLKAAATTLAPREAAYMVELFYEVQEQRIRAAAQIRMATEQGEPNALLSWMLANYATLEGDIRRAMDSYTSAHELGRWMRTIVGIGPVLAAGIMAHLDITRSPSASHFWSFAGLNPTQHWERGTKRPWNARLKVLAWKVSESLVMTSGHPRSFYGPLYTAYKARISAANEAGEYAEAAAEALRVKRFGAETVARTFYEQGKLPPAHIHARAERYVAKLFLAHVWTVAYELRYQRPAPRPYAIEHAGHVDFIPPPGWQFVAPTGAESTRA